MGYPTKAPGFLIRNMADTDLQTGQASSDLDCLVDAENPDKSTTNSDHTIEDANAENKGVRGNGDSACRSQDSGIISPLHISNRAEKHKC